MKKIVFRLTFVLLWAVSAAALDKPHAADPLPDWFTYYYLDKDSAKMPDFLRWLQKSGKLEKYPDAVPTVEGFLGVAFAGNPAQVEAWKQAATYTGKTKEAVEYALKPHAELKTAAVKTSADLDRNWGAYFASGDEAYLQNIVSLLATREGDALHNAAAWSLGVNMAQHESIDRFLQRAGNERKDATGGEIRQIIAAVQKQREARAFPNRNGDFSALMFVTDPKTAQTELEKASNSIMHFKEMAHAKVGDTRAVVIVFAGMQLTPDSHADVTYSVKITDPDGKIISDQKDLEGIKRKLPTRFRVFNNKAVVFIAFDKKDTPGTYKISATLHDNISGKAIPLASSIVLDK